MNRRQAVQRVALLLGGTILGSELFIQTGCKPKSGANPAGPFFTEKEIGLLDEIAETIIPRTDTPGAKDAKVGEFIQVMVRDCYNEGDQKVFREGMTTIDRLSHEQFSHGFMKITPDQRTQLLTQLDNEQKSYQKNKQKGQPAHYFRMMKELTLLGFFSSEPGATKVLRYAAVPGRYDPCLPYHKGDRAWY